MKGDNNYLPFQKTNKSIKKNQNSDVPLVMADVF